jgi:serine/threonine protein phosphatase PrpC
MALTDQLTTTSITAMPGARPRDDELDLFGLTHPGKVRRENQDHFLLCTVHPQVVIHGTSLPQPDRLPLRGERLGTIMLVADGVGGGTAGGEASQLAVETITRYVSMTLRCYHAAGSSVEEEFFAALRTAALEAHAAVRSEAAARVAKSARPDEKAMATTLTLAMIVWPWMYVVQVGDSRCYYYKEGVLRQVTRDQTIAQDLVDRGALPPERVAASPFSHVLASSIGGTEASPVVTRLDIRRRGSVILLCSDGLTKHVSDPEIAERLRVMESSEQACRALLDLALERGGSDNVTVLAGRVRGGAGSTATPVPGM